MEFAAVLDTAPVRKQRGFSLIELMVSLLLGAVLLGGVVTIFEQNKRNSVQDEQIARMQENGRFALNLLARNVMMSGFFGSVSDNDNIRTSWSSPPSCTYDGSKNLNDPSGSGSLFLVNDATASGFDCITSGSNPVKAGSDVLMVKRALGTVDMTKSAGGTNTGALTNGAVYLKTGARGDARIAAASSASAITSDTSVPNPATYWRYAPQVFFVRTYSATAGDGIPTLCREYLTDAAAFASECLVEGVEMVQVEFGIDNSAGDGNNVPDFYVANPTNAQIAQAITARIFVLMRSVSPIANYTNDKTYVLGTRAVDFDSSASGNNPPNDGFLRRVYSTTVLLRNAALRDECAWAAEHRPGLVCI